jgi:hypothetical protein
MNQATDIVTSCCIFIRFYVNLESLDFRQVHHNYVKTCDMTSIALITL